MSEDKKSFQKNLGKAFIALILRLEGLTKIDVELLEEISQNVTTNYDNDPEGVGTNVTMYVQGWMDSMYLSSVEIEYTLVDIIGFAREVVNDNS